MKNNKRKLAVDRLGFYQTSRYHYVFGFNGMFYAKFVTNKLRRKKLNELNDDCN